MEQICTLFHDQVIIIASILIALSMTISRTALETTGVFGGGTDLDVPNNVPKMKKFWKMNKQDRKCS